MIPERSESAARRLGFMAPLLLFVLLFVLCCGVLVCVFLRSDAVSRDAAAYDDAVTLCRSEAERFRSGDCAADGTQLYFDALLSPSSPEEAAYCLDFQRQDTPTVAGILATVMITARTPAGNTLYELEAAVYLPQEE